MVTKILFSLLAATALPAQEWPEWGGSGRDFATGARDLARTWPKAGPPQVWSFRFPKPDADGPPEPRSKDEREHRGGHGGLAVRGGVVCTAYCCGTREVAIALRAADGTRLWEVQSKIRDVRYHYGPGPFATPLLTRDTAFVQFGSGALVAVDLATGKVRWKRDLYRAFPGSPADHGYAASPLFHGGSLLVVPNAPGAAVAALNPATGATLWKRHDFPTDYASPLVVPVGSKDHLLVHLEKVFAAFDPEDGALFWSFETKSARTQHVTSPIATRGNRVFVNTTYSGTMYELTADPKPRATPVWTSRYIRMQVGNGVFFPRQDMIVAAGSASRPAFLVALDEKTGKLLWKDRGVDMGHLIRTGDDLIAVTYDGEVILAEPTRDGVTVRARCQPLQFRTWGAPAFVGTTLFARDDRRVVALDLGRPKRETK